MGERYVFDEKTMAALERQKPVYNVPTSGQALKRALALSIVMARYVSPEGILRIRDMRPGAPKDAIVEIPVRL